MGARINFVFKQYENKPNVILYSHWGESSWETDLAYALDKARGRWDDVSYGTRITITSLVGEQWGNETGFGIYTAEDEKDLGDFQVEVNFINQTVEGKPFDKFVSYHKGEN
jgi:hypothetical protein